MCRCWLGDVLGALQDNRPSASQGCHKFHGRYGRNGATYTCDYHDPYWLLSLWLWYAMTFNSQIVHWLVSSHEKINGHRELKVTTVVTAPGANDHGSVMARLGHGSVTVRSQLNHGDHGSIKARSQLNHGPGQGSVTAGCDHFGHCELTVNSPWAHSEQSWCITRETSWGPDCRNWLFSSVSVGLRTPIHQCW